MPSPPKPVTTVLALETSTLVCRVALLVHGELRGERAADATQASEALLPLIDAVLTDAGLAPGGVELFATSAGPGSFTGLRIGLATAKGLAFALARPLVTVSSLAALAATCATPGALVACAIDARRGDIFGALYRCEPGGGVTELLPDGLTTPAAFMAALAAHPGALITAGDGVGLCAGLPATSHPDATAAAVGRLALRKWQAAPVDELATAEPAYLRLAAPEERLQQSAAKSP